MSSVITIRSKWRDAAWSPERGSPLNPVYTYTLNGEWHILPDDEKQAGERVGCQTFQDYAQTASVYQQGTGGWELFDARPNKTEQINPMGDLPYSLAEDKLIFAMRQRGFTWTTIGHDLKRSPNGVSSRYSRIRKFYL